MKTKKEIKPMNTKKGIEQRDKAREYLSKKESTELKTLKDLAIFMPLRENPLSSIEWKEVTNKEGWIKFSSLKQEAIKWIKMYRSDPEAERLIEPSIAFMEFFNITEEELT